MTVVEAGDTRLNVEVRGDGPLLLLLHGFTGGIESWTPFVDAWRGFTTVAVDLPGHGGSDPPPPGYSMRRCASDLLSVLGSLGIRSFAALGYSMGGRLAAHLAAAAPERLWGLVLESASPGIEDETDRAARRKSDAALADEIERAGVEAFVRRWESLPLFASQSRLPEEVRGRQRRQRMGNSPAGLAAALRTMGAGSQDWLLPALGSLDVPALLVSGALDARYTENARRTAAEMPRARCTIVDDAGHAVHLEQPAVFGWAVAAFLEEAFREHRMEVTRCR